MFSRTITLLILTICLSGCRQAEPLYKSFAAPTPHPVPPTSDEQIRASIRRGVQFLLDTQSASGYWGTPRHKGGNVTMPVGEGFFAMRAGVTSLAVMALIETDDGSPEVEAAISKGEAWLIKNLPEVRRARNVIYSNWSHAYGIQAMVKLLERGPHHPERVRAIRTVIDGQAARLRRAQRLDGGWGYYNYGYNGPEGYRNSESNSFMTSTILVAFVEARAAGIEIPDAMLNRALESVRKQRFPDFCYGYHYSAYLYPHSTINRKPGSLARSQACNVATRFTGDEAVTDDVLRNWINRLFARHGWLDIPRKTHWPHAGYFGNAGYYFYYGHYYAMRGMEILPPEEWPHFQAQMAHVLLRLQEKDGSWWDFPLFNYHQAYGTAFALMSLERCLQRDLSQRIAITSKVKSIIAAAPAPAR